MKISEDKVIFKMVAILDFPISKYVLYTCTPNLVWIGAAVFHALMKEKFDGRMEAWMDRRTEAWTDGIAEAIP